MTTLEVFLVLLVVLGIPAFIYKEKIISFWNKTPGASSVVPASLREKVAGIFGISSGNRFFEELEAAQIERESNQGLWVRLKTRLGLAGDTDNKAVLKALFNKLDFADRTAEVVQAFANLMNRPFASLQELKDYLNAIHHQSLGLVTDIANLLPKYFPYTGHTPFEDDFAVVRAFLNDFRFMLNLWNQQMELIKDLKDDLTKAKAVVAEQKEVIASMEETLLKQTGGNLIMADELVQGLTKAAKIKAAKVNATAPASDKHTELLEKMNQQFFGLVGDALKAPRGGNPNNNQGNGNRQRTQQPNNQPNQTASATP